MSLFIFISTFSPDGIAQATDVLFSQQKNEGVPVLRSHCFGPESSREGVVYLHGLDTFVMNDQERSARLILWELAKKAQVKIALPRSSHTCSNRWYKKDVLCWKAGSPSEAKATLAQIIKASSQCMGERRRILLLGFSNGGWFTNKLLRWCIPTGFKWLAALGAAGTFDKHSPSKLDSKCGMMHELVGDMDTHNLQSAKNFAREGKLRSGQIKLIEFKGRHEMKLEPLMEILKSK